MEVSAKIVSLPRPAPWILLQSRKPRERWDDGFGVGVNGISYRLWFIYNGFVVLLAFVWRRLLFRTTFIGVTGSVGKTTAKECMYAVLSSKFPGVRTPASRSARRELPRTILRARPWHRFVVAEVAITEPGIMWRSALLLKPDIAVFLAVRRNHLRAFGSLERIADEKAKLLRGMSRRGLAILNADDPRVVSVASRLNCAIRWFGMPEECNYRFSQVRAKWPQRLSFTVQHGGQAEPVQTQLVGRHWVGSALAAIAVGHAMGIPLEEAVKPLAALPPFPQRLSPSVLNSGAIVIRDRERGSVDDLDAAIDILREYAEGRRILITSDGLDLEGNYRQRWKYLARLAANACDVCVCVGEKAPYGRRKVMEAGMADNQVHPVLSPGQVEAFLATETGPGDLVLWREGRR